MRLKKVNETYYVFFEADDGTQMEADTGCTNYEEAKAVAGESKAEELEKVAKVMRLTSDIVSRIVTGKEMTVNLALGRYKVWAMSNLTGRTAGSHISYVTKWIKDFNLEKVTPAAIEDNMVSGWVNSQGKGDENLKASTRRVRKAALSSFLGYCYNKGWMLTKPAELCRVQMDKLTHQQKETKSHEAMNDEDIKALMKEADAFWQMAIHLASVTGLRLGDVCVLEWACFDGNTVTVWTDKRDKRISVRVPTAVINSLCDLPVSDPTYLFPDRREVYRDVNRRAGLSVQFKRLCNRAAEKSGRNNGLKKKSFHGLRSYYAKTKKAKGVKTETIAKDLGHSSTKTTDVYLNTNQP